MKKHGVFIITSLTLFSLTLAANAEEKKEGLVKSFGNAVNNSVKSGVSKNVKGGFYGKSTIDAPEEKPAAKTDPNAKVQTATVTNTNTTTTNAPLDIGTVKKNQSREDLLASGILYLNSREYNKALDSFKKAQAISNDVLVQRWVDVANNKIKIKIINAQIDDLKSVPK